VVRVDRRESSILAILSLGSRGSAPNAETKITDLKLGCAVQLASLATFFYPLVAGLVSGAGIGLSIVQELVRAHGGRITVESEVGAGSMFRVVIPSSRPGPLHRDDRFATPLLHPHR